MENTTLSLRLLEVSTSLAFMFKRPVPIVILTPEDEWLLTISSHLSNAVEN
jgi:hypothetical protein